MNLKRIAVPFSLSLLAALAACNPQGSRESASGVLALFHEAVQKNDLETYDGILTGEAQLQYAGQAGLDGFRIELETFKKITIENEKLVAVTPNVDGRDAVRAYQVDLMTYTDNDKSIWHATEVLCYVTWEGTGSDAKDKMDCRISRII